MPPILKPDPRRGGSHSGQLGLFQLRPGVNSGRVALPQDRKGRVGGGIHRLSTLDLHLGHFGVGRALLTPVQERFQSVTFAIGLKAHPSIREISHPPTHSQLRRCFRGRVAEANSLNFPTYINCNFFHVLIRLGASGLVDSALAPCIEIK